MSTPEFNLKYTLGEVRVLKDSLTKLTGELIGVAMIEDDELPQCWDPFNKVEHTNLLLEMFGITTRADWGSNLLYIAYVVGTRAMVSVRGYVEGVIGHRNVPQEFKALTISLFLDAWAAQNNGSVADLCILSEKAVILAKRKAGIL